MRTCIENPIIVEEEEELKAVMLTDNFHQLVKGFFTHTESSSEFSWMSFPQFVHPCNEVTFGNLRIIPFLPRLPNFVVITGLRVAFKLLPPCRTGRRCCQICNMHGSSQDSFGLLGGTRLRHDVPTSLCLVKLATHHYNEETDQESYYRVNLCSDNL